MPSHRISVLLAGFVLLAGCATAVINPGQQSADNLNAGPPTAEQLARKERSEQRLLSEGIPFDAELPVIQSVADSLIRPEEAVENRVLCLITVALQTEEFGERLTQNIIREYDLEDHFSPQEKQFIDTGSAESLDGAARWRYESAWALLWSLGLVDSLSLPNKTAEIPKMVKLIGARNPESFRADARLRPAEELLDAADLIYRYHWAAHEDLDNGSRSRVRLNDAVIYERHYALNWLIGFMGQDWDDVDAEIADSDADSDSDSDSHSDI